MKVAFAAILSLVAATMAALPAHAEVSLPLGKKDKKKKGNHEFPATVSFRTSKDVPFTKDQIENIQKAIILAADESYDGDKFQVTKAGVDKASHGPVLSVQASKFDPLKYSSMIWMHFGMICNLCDPDDDDRLMATKKGKQKSSSHEKWESTLCDILAHSEDFPGAEGCEIYVDVDADADADLASDVVELVNPIVENAMVPLSALAELALPLGKKDKKKKRKNDHTVKATVSFQMEKDLDFSTPKQIVPFQELFIAAGTAAYTARPRFDLHDAAIDKATHGPVLSFEAVEHTALRGSKIEKFNPLAYSSFLWMHFGIICNLCDPDDDYRLMAMKKKGTKGKAHMAWEANLCEDLNARFDDVQFGNCEITVSEVEETMDSIVEE
jgi:hypothetical protein